MYCIDTSSLIASWDERYPPEFFPRFWDNLDGGVTAGKILSSMAVLNETSKRSKELHAWLSQRDTMFVDFEEDVQLVVRDILVRFPRLVGVRKHRTSADPFVIATAHLRGLVVVTEEKPTANLNRPNIPDVCAELDVRCINLIELIRAEKWVSG